MSAHNLEDQTPEQLALATAARLAHVLDPDGWARCDLSATTADGYLDQCRLPRGHAGNHQGMNSVWDDACPYWATLAEAQAEWAAAGGDPERGPALSGRSADGSTLWRIEKRTIGHERWEITIQVDGCVMWRTIGSPYGWTAAPNGKAHPLADWRECVRLAEAADGGAR